MTWCKRDTVDFLHGDRHKNYHHSNCLALHHALCSSPSFREGYLGLSLLFPEDKTHSIILVSTLGGSCTANTVRVKFVLQKECFFGQRFLLVGDDSAFGLWDPSNGIPLEWSDGHVWTVDVDLPIKKSIQFKFVLQGFSGSVNWQPGPNRTLQLWETKKSIVVSEDWFNAENQKICIEEPLNIRVNEVISDIVSKGTVLLNDVNQLDDTRKTHGGINLEKFMEGMIDEKRLWSDEGDRVLIPGLVPYPLSGSASELPKEAVVDEAKDCNSSQVVV